MPIYFILLFLAILFFILIVFAFIINISARLLVSVAFNRNPPKLIKGNNTLAKITRSPEFVSTLEKKAEQLELRETEEVEIKGRDGIKLRGHILESENPRRIIIAVHGWRGSWSRDFGIVSEFWKSSSTTVIYVEQRGQKGSDGDYITFGICERYDVLDWVRWAVEKYANLPIYLCGVSMGASSVLMSASLGLPRAVHGIIADSAFTSPSEIWSYVVSKNLHIPYGIYKGAANRECKRKTGQTADSCSTISSLKQCHTPILFIHGTDDSFVPVEMTYENFKACTSPKHLFVVPGANHGMSYYVDPRGYELQMCRFWQEYD